MCKSAILVVTVVSITNSLPFASAATQTQGKEGRARYSQTGVVQSGIAWHNAVRKIPRRFDRHCSSHADGNAAKPTDCDPFGYCVVRWKRLGPNWPDGSYILYLYLPIHRARCDVR